jgi:predicted ATPase/DNA-binding CsgD family transcriptional regulator
MLHHFPLQLTTFIGRGGDIQAIARHLHDPTCRLLTLVGPGGIGKTRLALEAAARAQASFRDGVYFIPLQSLGSAELLVYTIAEALGVGLYEETSPRGQLIQYLHPRKLLLILDNMEHLLDAADLLVSILAGAAGVKLLVTSREVLNLQGEQIVEVSGLALPEDNHPASEMVDSIRLFATRARQGRPDFSLDGQEAHVTRICRLVEGMPLGIELAAAWVRTLPCAEIAAEIEKNLDFLSTRLRDVPERHRSMRAVFDHSWGALSEAEKITFRRLSIFRGAFTRAAAETAAGASLMVLSELVNQSLVRVDRDGNYLIHELLRQYAGEKLAENPAEQVDMQARHSAYYLDLLRRLDPKLKSGEQIAALDEIERALDNIRAAWKYALEQHRGDWVEPAYECLSLYYQMRCRLGEAYDMFARAAAAFSGEPTPLRSGLLLSQCWFAAFGSGVNTQMIGAMAQEAADLLLRHGQRGLCAMTIGQVKWRVSDESARAIIDETIAAYRAKGDVWGMAWTLQHKGAYARHRKTLEEAIAAEQESLTLFEQIGDRWGATWAQAILGLIAEAQERYEDAYELYRTRLKACQDVGDAGGVAWSLQQIAKVSLELENIDSARYYCRESLRVALDISSGNSIGEAVLRIATMLHRLGDRERAAALCAVLVNTLDSSSYFGRRIREELERLKNEIGEEASTRALHWAQGRDLRAVGWLLLDELADAPPPPAVLLPGNETMSERELEVLKLAAAGLSNREIAERLFVTVGTVKKHLNNIFGKLGVERRTQAVIRARELNLLGSPHP